MATTWMCDNGHHGTAVLRFVADSWRPMFSGHCAGTVYNVHTREQTECSCECHNS